MQGLSFEYPTWFIIFCLLAGLAYAAVLYYRDRTFHEQPAWLRGVMGVLRFLAVSIMAMLLLSPLLRSLQTQTQRPIVVLAQDESESIAASFRGDDSTRYERDLAALADELSRDYDLKIYGFGDEVNTLDRPDFSFDEKRTNLSDLFRGLYDQYSNQNLGAIILATDGIYNEGSNPVYNDLGLNAPIYSIALGDTTRRKDLTIKRVFNNRIAYLGDKFTVQVDVSAQNAAGATTNMTVSRVGEGGTQVLTTQTISIDRPDFFTTREVILDADRPGVQRFRISLSAISGEETTANNVRDIFIDILDARQKILILANAPHPDITALRQSLEGGLNNQVEIGYQGLFQGNVLTYDMVILHQLPGQRGDVTAMMNSLRERGTPVWFILGDQTSLGRFNQVQQLLSVRGSGQSVNDVQARLANDFSLFNLSEELTRSIASFPPMQAPFGDYAPGAGASVMLYQRIGRVDTQYPLLVFGEENGARQAVLAAAGLWQWRLYDFLENQNHERFDELVSKIVQYLSVKDDNRRFRVSLPKNIFDENESVTLDAELYNESYELINEPDVTLLITDANGRDYSYTFNRSGRAYTLNAGILPVGNYRYRATANTGAQPLTYEGQFSIQPIQVERYVTTADHNLLRLLAERYGGEVVYPTQLAELPTKLQTLGSVKPVIYQSVTTRSVINLKWIFFLILALLTAEWVMRRYYGAY